MKRTTIFIDEVAEKELEYLARRRGKAKATLVREAIGEYLLRARGEDPEAPLAFVAIGRSGRSDIAERHEELLFLEEEGSSSKRARRPARSGRR
jgi:hypothetical protein